MISEEPIEDKPFPPADILVVDDEPAIRFFLENVLTRDGHRVVVADSGEDALEHLKDREFDLALIDLKMKEVGGLEVLSALRENVPTAAAIVLTAHGSLDTAIEALRLGAHDYLLKPTKTAKLRRSVRAALFQSRREKETHNKASFASDIVHEMRNSLGSISLYLHLLERDNSDRRPQYLQHLRQETARMGKFVDNYLTLSRMEASNNRHHAASEDMNVVVGNVVNTQRRRAEAAGLELTFEPEAGLPPARIEREPLTKVVTNLIVNAINYTPEGAVRVSTCSDADRRRAGLNVQDTGLGIAPEDVRHLFERFYRGRQAVNSDIPGTGLGLAIVKEIVDRHQGEIEVESQVDEGSTFTVWLPLADQGEQ